MIIKLHSERRGEHVHERVFVGWDAEHLALAGTLVLDVGQWQEFGAALMLGAQRMHGRLRVLSPDDMAVVRSAADAR